MVRVGSGCFLPSECKWAGQRLNEKQVYYGGKRVHIQYIKYYQEYITKDAKVKTLVTQSGLC